MSEELTLEEAIHEVDCGVAINPDAYHNEKERLRIDKSIDVVLDAARAHLSRPVVGDEQMRNALTIADEHKDDEYYCDAACEEWTELALVSRTLLAMSEQLAAEQEKVKALQPYKDAYDDGQDRKVLVGEISGYQTIEGRGFNGGDTVRVCKLVEGDG